MELAQNFIIILVIIIGIILVVLDQSWDQIIYISAVLSNWDHHRL